MEIRAGPGGESSDVYAFNTKSLPSWIKSVDDPVYAYHSHLAYEAAKKIVRETGKKITLKMDVTYRP
jgi:hypothetical protein